MRVCGGAALLREVSKVGAVEGRWSLGRRTMSARFRTCAAAMGGGGRPASASASKAPQLCPRCCAGALAGVATHCVLDNPHFSLLPLHHDSAAGDEVRQSH